MNFGEKLKSLRLEAGMTQEELASRCGMKKQNISRYERSGVEPNLRTAKLMADALGIPIEALVVSEMTQSDKDARLLAWFRSLPPEKQQAILIAQDGPTDAI